MSDTPFVHVAAAAICDQQGRVLLARRHDDAHLGGLWEFPGGKFEDQDEGVRFALIRELNEELGVTPTGYRPLIRVHHTYPDKQVLLDVWRVDAWEGEPHGREGQPIEWVSIDELQTRDFPPANLPIISALQLPDRYLITPEPGDDKHAFFESLLASLKGDISLVQLRAKHCPPERLQTLVKDALEICHEQGVRLALNAAPELALELGMDGVHLTCDRLMALQERPLGEHLLVGASCHNLHEVTHACNINVDFIVAGPVRETSSHPEAAAMGWRTLFELTERSSVPVYALGGMIKTDLTTAWRHGAQGIAAIGAFWKTE